MLKLIENARMYHDRIGLRCHDDICTYYELLKTSDKIALQLLDGKKDLNEARIAFIVQPGIDYVCIQWGIWRAGGIAVPLCVKHPYASIKYVIEDTHASIIIFEDEFAELLGPLKTDTSIRFIHSKRFHDDTGHLPEIHPDRRAMILYTSGTTGLPKGVVTTHANIESQITALTTSWEWAPSDHILNVLPLHHVHGIINVLSCALWSGACCEFLPRFDPKDVFDIFVKKQVNVFMAVPTIYYKLIAYWDQLSQNAKVEIAGALPGFRLMVSGSAALPVSVMEKWATISGHQLLERYGMTEIGMAISNPYHGDRQPGHIGQPLPGVNVRIVDEQNEVVSPGNPGEIQVKGSSVFKEYWNKPEETEEAFTADGWFKTGDIALLDGDSYKILGRSSVDIIKSGGYKISALEIEDVLRKHPKINDCGVVGIPDEEWGEIIGASLILDDTNIDMDELKTWLRDRLPGYKTPRKFMIQEDLPRNVMGKVTKKALQQLFITTTQSS